MEEMLQKEGVLTVFAPNDGGFDLPGSYNPENPAFKVNVIGDLEEILKDKDSAERMIKHHLLPERLTFEELMDMSSVTAIDKLDIPLDTSNGNLLPGNADVIIPDIECTNGLIHVVSQVLNPTL